MAKRETNKKKKLTSEDVLDIIKIIITLFIGYILVKALLAAI
tara:strand:+ start:520 stop:645 length:126 start_codon:yes stop_codon:yes gene_type:complete